MTSDQAPATRSDAGTDRSGHSTSLIREFDRDRRSVTLDAHLPRRSLKGCPAFTLTTDVFARMAPPLATTAAIAGSDALDCFSIVDMPLRLGQNALRGFPLERLLCAHRQPIVDGYHSWR